MLVDISGAVRRHGVLSSVLRRSSVPSASAFGRIISHSSDGDATSASSSTALSLFGKPDAVDLTRIGMRLSAMQSYALIASLLLGSGLYLFAITPVKVDDIKASGKETKLQQRLIAAFTVIVSISIATALHTAITFTVMTLYANTALGQGLDQQFLSFWNAPSIAKLRKNAFHSFVASILTFKLSFALSIFIKSDGKQKWIATAAATVVMLASGIAFWQMVRIASQLIFH